MFSLTAEYLKSILEYDPETGVWRWLFDYSRSVKAGQIAGHIRRDKYRQIAINRKTYFSARLAVLYMTGQWPEEQVDHINRDRGDDRWVNIRQAGASDNNANRSLQSNNTSGYVGVSWDSNSHKWDVRVNRKHIGYFDDLEEAVEARDAFATIMQGSFASLNSPKGGYLDP